MGSIVGSNYLYYPYYLIIPYYYFYYYFYYYYLNPRILLLPESSYFLEPLEALNPPESATDAPDAINVYCPTADYRHRRRLSHLGWGLPCPTTIRTMNGLRRLRRIRLRPRRHTGGTKRIRHLLY